MLRTVCIFCGSSLGAKPAYARAAADIGTLIARSGRRIVFGGGGVGLMGTVADAALAAGGDVIGIIPQHLVDREIAHKSLTELRVVRSMHERKALMSELSDGFIALPGGLGTLEEFLEVWTWGQLGLHQKPHGLLNVDGYFSPLLEFLDRTVTEGFFRPEYRDMVVVESEPARLLARMEETRGPVLPRWIEASET